MNTFYKYLSITLFTGLLAMATPVFAGPNNCNISNISFFTTANITLNSAEQNTAQFGMSGNAGDDMACPYTMNIYVGNNNSVSPGNFFQSVTAGTMANTGSYSYSNKVVSGLSAGTTYYAIACVIDQSNDSVCSSALQFSTQSAGSGGGGGGGGVYQVAPVVGSVSVWNTNNYSTSVSANIQSLGCSAETWFEYGRNGLTQSTSHQNLSATLSGALSGTLANLSSGSQYSVRAVARNCIGTTYGPTRTFTTLGSYSGSNNNNGYNSSSTNSTNHSQESYDPTDGLIINEDDYYYSNFASNTSSYINSYSSNQYVGNGVYHQNDNYQYVSNGLYRGNGGDLRVYDEPFDITGLSNSVRGGVASSYTNYSWGGSSSATAAMWLGVLALGVIAYSLGRKSA